MIEQAYKYSIDTQLLITAQVKLIPKLLAKRECNQATSSELIYKNDKNNYISLCLHNCRASLNVFFVIIRGRGVTFKAKRLSDHVCLTLSENLLTLEETIDAINLSSRCCLCSGSLAISYRSSNIILYLTFITRLV